MRRIRYLRSFGFAAWWLTACACVWADEPPVGETVSTFSILAYDPETGELGGAVQSRVFSVGNGVLWAQAGVGAVATQAVVNVAYGPRGLELLAQGLEPDEIVRRVYDEDPDAWPDAWPKAGRQFAVLDASGRHAALTGSAAPEWAGTATSRYATAQGNLLASPAVVAEMIRAFEGTEGPLARRLVAALAAGQAAGGDRRGMQSAAILIVKEGAGMWLNNDVVMRLQVDDDPEPITELGRLVELALAANRRMEALRELPTGR
jgi:uncharacterized Ntn-hydrolase superfamily protein